MTVLEPPWRTHHWRVWLRPGEGEPFEPFEHYSSGSTDELGAIQFAAQVYLLGRTHRPRTLTGSADRICGAVTHGITGDRMLCTHPPRHGGRHFNDTAAHAWDDDERETA